VHVALAQHQLQLFLAKIGIDQRQRDDVEGGEISSIPRITMVYRQSLEIEQRLETVLRLVRTGCYSTPGLA